MTYLLEHSLKLQRLYLLKFGGDEHTGHSSQMDLLRLVRLLGLHQESIHQTHSGEKGVVGKLKGTDDLNHPIHHPAPEILWDVVSAKNV